MSSESKKRIGVISGSRSTSESDEDSPPIYDTDPSTSPSPSPLSNNSDNKGKGKFFSIPQGSDPSNRKQSVDSNASSSYQRSITITPEPHQKETETEDDEDERFNELASKTNNPSFFARAKKICPVVLPLVVGTAVATPLQLLGLLSMLDSAGIGLGAAFTTAIIEFCCSCCGRSRSTDYDDSYSEMSHLTNSLSKAEYINYDEEEEIDSEESSGRLPKRNKKIVEIIDSPAPSPSHG